MGIERSTRDFRDRRVRTINADIDVLPDGTYRVRPRGCRGWAAVASYRVPLGRVLEDAFTESEVAAYAQGHGEAYDQDVLTEVDKQDPTTASQRGKRRNVKGSRVNAQWAVLDDGRWLSPGGRKYRPDSQMVLRVRAAFHADGKELPPGA